MHSRSPTTRLRWWWAAAAALLLAACGGADTSPEATLAALRAKAAQIAGPSQVAPEEAARQLMDFGESVYPQYFPGHKATQALSPFVYRFYPEMGTYLGVVVSADPAYALGGVYIMGGAFGTAPSYVGPLATFITPLAPLVWDRTQTTWDNATWQ